MILNIKWKCLDFITLKKKKKVSIKNATKPLMQCLRANAVYICTRGKYSESSPLF